MSSKNVKIALVLLSIFATVVACGLPASSDTTETDPAEIAATEAGATEVTTTGASDQQSAPPSGPASDVQHQTIPVGLPEKQSGQAGDFDSSAVLNNGSLVGGDRFTFGRFERPFNANTMDVYFSQIDIVDTQVFEDDIWIYGKITLKELSANSSSSGKYAIELDTNLDGKGDWLIIASKPSSTDWDVAGVQVFEDANNNVGGELPTLTDNNPVNSDGFEALVFDQGQGNDPDSAWARISPNDANTVEISIKKSVLGDAKKYLINMWAGSQLDPALFDLNDKFTHEQAGASDEGLQVYYPIKEVAEIDNSCRMAVGFQPTGQEAGICDVYKPQNTGDPAVCNASFLQIAACNLNNDPSYSCSWNSKSCNCDCAYVGPK